MIWEKIDYLKDKCYKREHFYELKIFDFKICEEEKKSSSKSVLII